ncbi:MAG: ATP-binding protein [Armatimonadetes bacterium]|nr:ATP-binding protein [Armatimonadota bacterium]
MADVLSTEFPHLLGQVPRERLSRLTQADCLLRWSGWEWAEQQLRNRCRGCAGAGLYDLDGLPRIDACRKPVLREDLTVDMEVCPVQVAFRARVAAKQLLGESRIPKRFQRRTLERFQPCNWSAKLALDIAWDFVRRWGEPELPGLLIMGPNGTGKTHLAAGIMLELIKREVAVRFYTVPELLARVRDGISRDEADDVQEILAEIPLLVIDDLGKEYLRPSETGTSWAQEVIYTILNRRYEEDRPVIVTTNLTDAQIEQRYGLAVVSRLAEMCRTVVLDGPDYRLGLHAADCRQDGGLVP